MSAGVSEGSDEQVDLDRFVADGDLAAAEIDLKLLARWSLESHRRLVFGGQRLAIGFAGAFQRPQADG